MAMGRVEITIPLVTWRDGRPRFFASAVHRTLGYKGEDLRHGKAGPWFTVEQCVAWSAERRRELATRRQASAAGAPQARELRPASGGLSVDHVLTAFRDLNPRMQGVSVIDGRRRRRPLAPATVRAYAAAIRLLEKFNPDIMAAPAQDLAGDVLSKVLEQFETRHGLAQTRALRAMLSAAYSWAASRAGKRRVAFNPVAELEERLPMLEPRVRYGTDAEMDHLVAVADALGCHDVGDVVMLGLFTGQRQADRLALEDMQMTPDGIIFQQRKKGGQPLLIPMIDELRDRVRAAADRRRLQATNHAHVLLDGRSGLPWHEDVYRKRFRVVRHVAATGTLAGLKAKDGQIARELFAGAVDPLRGSGEARAAAAETFVTSAMALAGLKPLASLADFRDQDLRDTAVTWLTLSGCDKFEVAAITGHALKSIDQILAHYFGIHPELARRAMAKLQARRSARHVARN